MKDVLYEETAKVRNEKACTVRYNIFRVMSIISYVMMGLWVIIIFNFFSLKNVTFLSVLFNIIIPLGMFFASGFVLGRVKNKMYVDYDYSFVTGSIRISKVIKNIKRKSLFKFDCSNIEKIGNFGSDTFEKYSSMPGVKKVFLTSNTVAEEGKSFYYIVAMVDGEKKLMIVECTELFIVNILKFSSKGILEEEFTNKK